MIYHPAARQSPCYVLPSDRPPQTILTRLRDWFMDVTGQNTTLRRYRHIVDALRLSTIIFVGSDCPLTGEVAIRHLDRGDGRSWAWDLAAQGIGRDNCVELSNYLAAHIRMQLDMWEKAKHDQ